MAASGLPNGTPRSFSCNSACSASRSAVARDATIALEEGRLGDRPGQRHQPLLQVGLADRYPARIHQLVAAQVLDQRFQLRPVGLDLVHQGDLVGVELPVALDLAM